MARPDTDIDGYAHYLTFSCQERRSLFLDDEMFDTYTRYLARARSKGWFELLAYVVMPSHVHLIIIPDNTEMKGILRALKQPFSHWAKEHVRNRYPDIYRQLSIPSGTQYTFRFWLRGGGYDRLLSSEDEIREKIKYMHRNPVRKELAALPEEWKWSSFRYYLTGDVNPIAVDRPSWI